LVFASSTAKESTTVSLPSEIFATSADDFEEIARAHGAVFRDVRPACTYVVTSLIDSRWRVEIEAEALIA